MTHPQVRADLGRAARTGEPEVVYAAGKSPAQTVEAVNALLAGGVAPVLVTRAGREHVDALKTFHPQLDFTEDAQLVSIGAAAPVDRVDSGAVVVTAGTSDLAVAHECTGVLEALGHQPALLADVGVAGLHRVLEVRETLEQASVVIVVAGMEAALGPVVAGLVPAPVVAVPTSVGYGAAQGGITAMHGLLAACTPGMAVVNVDNGLGAAMFALRVLAMCGARGARAE